MISVVFVALIQTLAEDSSGKGDCYDKGRKLAERVLALRESHIERIWWRDRRILRDQNAISAALADGYLIPMQMGNGFNLSAKMELRIGTPQLRLFMEDLVRLWRAEAERLDLDPLKHDLIVSSLVRTHIQQISLINSGAPAADVSSHTRGVALDIGKAWFEKHDPKYAEALEIALRIFYNRGNINLISEDLAGVWHICLSPPFHFELSDRLGLVR